MSYIKRNFTNKEEKGVQGNSLLYDNPYQLEGVHTYANCGTPASPGGSPGSDPGGSPGPDPGGSPGPSDPYGGGGGTPPVYPGP